MSQNNYPKLHNATWPGIVGKGPDSEPIISFDDMLQYTAAATGTLVVFEAEHLRRVLVNLLDNAVKFTPMGGQIEVELRVTQLEDCTPALAICQAASDSLITSTITLISGSFNSRSLSVVNSSAGAFRALSGCFTHTRLMEAFSEGVCCKIL